ncbi:MAG: hypothetical protein ABI197_08060 [Granulicella sp.]
MSEIEQKSEHHVVPVYIDRVHYDAPSHHLPGHVLRGLSKPPVPEDRDLWQEVEGPTDDILIRPEGSYEVHEWTHYYTAPKTINPGAS